MKMNFNKPRENSNAQVANTTTAPKLEENQSASVAPKAATVGLKIGGKLINKSGGDRSQIEPVVSSENTTEIKKDDTKSPSQAPVQTTGINYETQVEGIVPELMKEFEESKKILSNHLTENTEMIGFALRRIMVDLKLHPELAEFLLPEDMGNMVRGLRLSYGNALKVKESKSRKKKKSDDGGIGLVDLADLDVAGL